MQFHKKPQSQYNLGRDPPAQKGERTTAHIARDCSQKLKHAPIRVSMVEI